MNKEEETVVHSMSDSRIIKVDGMNYFSKEELKYNWDGYCCNIVEFLSGIVEMGERGTFLFTETISILLYPIYSIYLS